MGHRQSRIEHWGAVMARFGESGQDPAAFCRECGERGRRRLDGRPRRLRGHLQGERRRLLGVAAGRPPQA